MTVIHKSPAKALQLEASMIAEFKNPATNNMLKFWTTDQCLVVPTSVVNNPGYAAACVHMRNRGWPVYVRKTGGGVTPQGLGILNVAVAYAADQDENPTISGVYQMFCAPLIEVMARFGCVASTGFVKNSFCDGAYNIVVDGKKVMGTAQRWARVRSNCSRQVIFAHALLLFDTDFKASVDAVNHFNAACGVSAGIEQRVHANLLGLIDHQGDSNKLFQVVNILSGLYQEELSALSG